MHFTTTSGLHVLIDDDRADLAALRGWFMHSSGYIVRELPRDERRRTVFLHHEVLGTRPQRGVHVDHRNGDHLDNRRANLRVCTPSENAQNRPLVTKRGTYRGVTWHKGHEKWVARATLNYRTVHIGYFDTDVQAADAVRAWRAEHMTHSDADRAET